MLSSVPLSRFAWLAGALALALAGCRSRPPRVVGAHLSLRFRIGRAMPLCGERVGLTAWVLAAERVGRRATVHFVARQPGGAEREICPPIEVEASRRGPTRVVAEWVPDEVGPWAVTCRVSAGQVRMKAAREAWVTASRLHFVYWGCALAQRHVTAVMANDKEQATSHRWRHRGVAALRWKGGACYRETRKTPEDYVVPWSRIEQGHSGILIDELGGGTEADQVMGKALVELRRRRPEMLIVPYCVGLEGEDMVAGLRASDLVLAECYAGDWRHYGVFGRWEAVARHGLADRTLAALGIGRGWATTEAEVRRQFACLRSRYPGMPGMAFFPEVPPRLSAAVDKAIEDYFLRPALLVRWDVGDATATVLNIGQLPARDAVAVLEGARARETPLATLAAGAATTLRVPDGTSGVRIRPAPGRYTVVAYESPAAGPLPDRAATVRAAAALAALARGPSVHLLAREPSLALTRSQDEQGRAEYTGNVEAATLALGEHAARVRGLSVDLEVGRCAHYGTIGLELRGGDASLGFRLCHHEPDGDLPRTSPRLTAWFQDASGGRVQGTMPPGLEPGRVYRVVLARSAGGGARVVVWEKARRLLWDSGPWRPGGEARFAAVRFAVRPFRDSAIRWEPRAGRLFLRGVSAGPLPSPYRLEGWLSNLTLHLTTEGPSE